MLFLNLLTLFLILEEILLHSIRLSMKVFETRSLILSESFLLMVSHQPSWLIITRVMQSSLNIHSFPHEMTSSNSPSAITSVRHFPWYLLICVTSHDNDAWVFINYWSRYRFFKRIFILSLPSLHLFKKALFRWFKTFFFMIMEINLIDLGRFIRGLILFYFWFLLILSIVS